MSATYRVETYDPRRDSWLVLTRTEDIDSAVYDLDAALLASLPARLLDEATGTEIRSTNVAVYRCASDEKNHGGSL